MYKISLAAARVNAKLTQRDVARELGVSPATVINWETGRSAIDADKFISLCDLYACPMDIISLPSMST